MPLPPQPDLVYLDDAGQVSFRWDHDSADQFAFYEWLEHACPHGPLGELVSHRLGNISSIAYVRGTLAHRWHQLPILLNKVVYDGTHAGDHIKVSDLDALDRELELLKEIHADDPRLEEVVRDFQRQMLELVTAALGVKKPIVFL